MTDSDEVKLLPCAWCGEAEDIRIVDIEDCGPEGSWEATAMCGRCEARAPTSLWYSTQAEATHEAYVRWNTRPPVVTDEVVERLRNDIGYHAEQLATYIAQSSISEKNLASARFHNNKIRAALASMPAVVSGGQGSGAFNLGDLVQKKGRALWRGKVVGSYQTELTELGYAVESSFEPGSVQIYPSTALLPWDGAAQPDIGK